MGRYSIKELEQLSGIKAHTIRIWEKRHKLVEPSRTQTNIRYYSDEDLKKIIGVSVLNNHGVKISKIATLTSDQINKKIEEITQKQEDTQTHIDQLILSMIDLDEDHFEKILASLILRYGFEKTVIEIVYPFLEKIGILWLTSNITPAQEHFISNLIRQKIIVAIDSLPLAPKSAPGVVLFLPENELHELGLLYAHYLFKKQGWRTYYLGQSVPYANLKQVIEVHSPKGIVTSLSSNPKPEKVQDFINRLATDFREVKIFATGYLLKNKKINLPPNVSLFESAKRLVELIAGS